MPDEELLTLADQRKLTQPATLRAQVERLLNHPKAGRVGTELCEERCPHCKQEDGSRSDGVGPR